MNPVVKQEKIFFRICFVLASAFWIVAFYFALKFSLISILLTLALFLFGQSALISTLKGDSVKISAEQFPDLYQKFTRACETIKMPIPDAYLMNGNGLLNAFATRYLRQNYVVLFSDVVDSLEERNGSIDFYIGHELGHLHRKHLNWRIYFLPLTILPLLIPAYYRACEMTCDRYGALCSESQEDSNRALFVLAAGNKRWKSMNASNYIQQTQEAGGFWMSFFEITAHYPWLSKRVALLQTDPALQKYPNHSWFAWILGLLCPGFMPGRLFPFVLFYCALISNVRNFAPKAQNNSPQNSRIQIEPESARPMQKIIKSKPRSKR